MNLRCAKRALNDGFITYSVNYNTKFESQHECLMEPNRSARAKLLGTLSRREVIPDLLVLRILLSSRKLSVY